MGEGKCSTFKGRMVFRNLFIYFKVVTNYQRSTILLLKGTDCREVQTLTKSSPKKKGGREGGGRVRTSLIN
jgi:hypothetical protein